MKSYPLYQDTGIKWLGRIPNSWCVKRIKHNTYVKGRVGWQGLNSNEFGSFGPCLVTGTDFKNGRIDWETCYHVSTERYDEDPFIQLQNQDLLITKDGTIGKVAIVENLKGQATLNSGVFVTRPKNDDYITPYLFWLLNSNVFSLYIDYTKTGSTVQHLYQATFVEFSFPVPSIPEQKVIADYLTRKTAKIDTLIAKKQRQIDLLLEQRTATINQAVTKGLNPSVPMKDSRIDWVGKIPKHWSVTSLGYHARMIVPMRDKPKDFDGEIPWIRIEDFDGKYISGSKSNQKVSEQTISDMNLKVFPIGTVLCSCSCNMGASAIVSSPLISNQTFIGIVPDSDLYSSFLYYLIQASTPILNSLGTGAVQKYLSRNDFEHFTVALPSFREQESIADYLDYQTTKLDNLIERTHQQIELLKELRDTLVSEAVTGKIDVRGGA